MAKIAESTVGLKTMLDSVIVIGTGHGRIFQVHRRGNRQAIDGLIVAILNFNIPDWPCIETVDFIPTN